MHTHLLACAQLRRRSHLQRSVVLIVQSYNQLVRAPSCNPRASLNFLKIESTFCRSNPRAFLIFQRLQEQSPAAGARSPCVALDAATQACPQAFPERCAPLPRPTALLNHAPDQPHDDNCNPRTGSLLQPGAHPPGPSVHSIKDLLSWTQSPAQGLPSPNQALFSPNRGLFSPNVGTQQSLVDRGQLGPQEREQLRLSATQQLCTMASIFSCRGSTDGATDGCQTPVRSCSLDLNVNPRTQESAAQPLLGAQSARHAPGDLPASQCCRGCRCPKMQAVFPVAGPHGIGPWAPHSATPVASLNEALICVSNRAVLCCRAKRDSATQDCATQSKVKRHRLAQLATMLTQLLSDSDTGSESE